MAFAYNGSTNLYTILAVSNASKRRPGGPARMAPGRPARLTDAAIIERIMRAIVEHRLPPGTKLGEDRLGAAFGVSRTRVRQVLTRLAADKVVTQIANRGAFVAQPSVAEARAVFDARRVIEAELVARAATVCTDADAQRLERHLVRERAAERAGDVRAMIQLSGEFHRLIADIAGNAVLTEMLRELVARSSLILALYGSPRARDCANDDHRALLAAIRRHDARTAASRMREHLGHLEAAFELPPGHGEPIDLAALLGPGRDRAPNRVARPRAARKRAVRAQHTGERS